MSRNLRLIFAATLACTVLVSPALSGQQASPLAGIAHIALRVRSLDASRTFYQSIGFEEAFDLKRDGIAYESFIKINDHQFIELHAATASNTSPAFLHLCFEADDLGTIRDEYVSHGLTPSPLKKSETGNLLFTLGGPAQPAGTQPIEYTQYLPESQHSIDAGKHIGADRLADRILSVAVAVKDVEAARVFYSNDLAFKQLPAEPMLYHLPGVSGDQVEIAPDTLGRQARFTLQTASVPRAARRLTHEHIKFAKTRELLTFSDPDGNTILIQQR